MHNNSKYITAFALAALALALAGCGNDGPTSSSDFDTSNRTNAGQRSLAVETFNCTNLNEVHVRFSEVGPIDGEAKLLFNYGQVPDGIHALNVIWDETNHPQTREAIDITEGTTPSSEDGFVDIKGTATHNYLVVDVDTTRQVRVELTKNGEAGNCSTVRRIVQKAPPTPTPTPPPDPCRGTLAVSRLLCSK